MKSNNSTKGNIYDRTARLAAGHGGRGARQSAEQELRRLVMSCLLFEDIAYDSGQSVTDRIRELVPLVAEKTLYEMAIEARAVQKLRHVPLLIAREMARNKSKLVGSLLPQIIQRADEITEFLALYFADGRQPLSKQVKKGLAAAFEKFDSYHFAKYNRKTDVTFKDALRLVHPKPSTVGRSILYGQILNDDLETPYTWETQLSKHGNNAQTWNKLIRSGRLGALAYLRNLRNMEQAGVNHELIRAGLNNLKTGRLLPINYISAAKATPRFEKDIEALMLRGLSQFPKLHGRTIFVVDVSGSMRTRISGKSQFARLEVAAAMAVLANEMCEDVSIYVTAGSDGGQKHKTKLVPNRSGFALSDAIVNSCTKMGGGGIFTRQCLEWIRRHEGGAPDRIIVFSDSQDTDQSNSIPAPFGRFNYIIDVSSHSHGVNYAGVWDAEVSGWSEHFLKFIQAYEMEKNSRQYKDIMGGNEIYSPIGFSNPISADVMTPEDAIDLAKKLGFWKGE